MERVDSEKRMQVGKKIPQKALTELDRNMIMAPEVSCVGTTRTKKGGETTKELIIHQQVFSIDRSELGGVDFNQKNSERKGTLLFQLAERRSKSESDRFLNKILIAKGMVNDSEQESVV
ncbi:hypothetical protein NPIL_152331 [Nephila pilipes]|uniref:Uncharacterized protein n=1 Tax=Nephila pilipes TaxID=299642 RepID=A0A8X6TRA5_NEPPI|nr:hypothetical protein NPIL_152331 [Nephila pilipes]